MSSKERLKSVLWHLKTHGTIDMGLFNLLSKSEKELIMYLNDEGLIEDSWDILDSLDTEHDWKMMKDKIKKSKKPLVVRLRPILKYVAIFIGLFALVYHYRTEGQDKDLHISGESVRLSLGKGDVKVIDQSGFQRIISATGEVLGEQKGNTIRYIANSKVAELVYNELEIPNGKIFNLELSDGTVINLNSGTKIKYPTTFLPGQKREVFIDGEAYFKVAHDEKRPFTVHANAVAVQVLGTEFNVSSYPEDESINAVLVKGSISMSNTIDPEDDIILTPGNKGAWDKTSHETKIEKVEVNLYTSWITGDMVFRNSSFANMADKLERRYNVTIQNNNLDLDDKLFNARFNVDIESINDVMKLISQIHPFNYKFNGQKIIID